QGVLESGANGMPFAAASRLAVSAFAVAAVAAVRAMDLHRVQVEVPIQPEGDDLVVVHAVVDVSLIPRVIDQAFLFDPAMIAVDQFDDILGLDETFRGSNLHGRSLVATLRNQAIVVVENPIGELALVVLERL